ncbi:hypothetical protein NSQ59_27740 [Margalitia sp. FSL K6-0131]|uniref:hypothetical protein n=1 Tax=Margalitia sp. FSL K6-0131 TaxID=2954604 RepID=UPI0030FAB68B
MENNVKKMIEEAPERCPITGLEKCENYVIDENVVYLPYPPYDAYTLPVYDENDKAFYRTKYDMDDDFREEVEYLCDLADLANHPNLIEIKKFYNIM